MIERKTKVVENIDPNNIPEEIFLSEEPLILKNLVSDWALVKAGEQSTKHVMDCILSAYNNKPLVAYYGKPNSDGKYFYNENFTALDFEKKSKQLNDVFEDISSGFGQDEKRSIFMPSISLDNYFPNLKKENQLSFSGLNPSLVQMWVGNPSLVSCHFDSLNNIACCVVGKRQFTLFPPEQIENLYIGPMDNTPAGQAVSTVDFKAPDFKKYPLFKKALKAGQIADLSPGDALFLPNLWWHQVEALSEFNTMINYWWRVSPVYRGEGMIALQHAMLSIKSLPKRERLAWRSFFDYYVFNDPEKSVEHLPDESHGILGEVNEQNARKIRAMLINSLNR